MRTLGYTCNSTSYRNRLNYPLNIPFTYPGIGLEWNQGEDIYTRLSAPAPVTEIGLVWSASDDTYQRASGPVTLAQIGVEWDKNADTYTILG